MVGDLGPEAISAVGISRVITMVVTIMIVSATTGAFAMVAQFIGAGSHREASATAKQSFTLSALISILLSLLGILVTPLCLEALSLSPAVVAQATPYLRVFFAGLVFMTLNFAITNCLYGAGDARTPLYIGLLISIVKVTASYLLIFGVWGLPRMGVTGAALGTVIGRICGVLTGFALLYSGRFKIKLLPDTSYLPDADLARRILRIGIPSALQGFFRNSSSLVFVKLVALTEASTAAVAAFSIGNQMERVLRRTSLAFGTAATTLVGQSLGARHPELAAQRGWTTILIGVSSLILCGLPVVLFSGWIMTRFTDVPQVVHIGIVYLCAMALAEPFMCLSIIAGGALRGAGDTRPALYHTLIAQWLIRLPVGYVLAFHLGYDIDGLWAALVVFSALQGYLTLMKFKKGEWKDREI
jgi:putative MATE family efflux protein